MEWFCILTMKTESGIGLTWKGIIQQSGSTRGRLFERARDEVMFIARHTRGINRIEMEMARVVFWYAEPNEIKEVT